MHFLTMDSLRAEIDSRREQLTRAWQRPPLFTAFRQRLHAFQVRRAPTAAAVPARPGLSSQGTL